MQNELVSVIMSVYNETEEELNLSIHSILNQTYNNLEFIIVNDNPNREDLNKILYSFKDERIILLENTKNEGLVFSLNKALKIAKGKYIARMDADDISDIYRIEKQLKYMNNYSCDIISTNIKLFGKCRKMKQVRFIYYDKEIKYLLKHGINVLPHPGWIAKRELFEKMDGYRPIFACEDYDFLLRAIRVNCKFGIIREPLLSYRIRQSSISNMNKTRQFLTRLYLSKNINRIEEISNEEIDINIKQSEINDYNDFLVIINSVNKMPSIKTMLNLICNKYFYSYMYITFIKKIIANYCLIKEKINNKHNKE